MRQNAQQIGSHPFEQPNPFLQDNFEFSGGRILPPELGLTDIPSVIDSNVGDGLDGNIDTITQMKKIARKNSSNPLIRKLAENILLWYQVPSAHYVDEALAIGDYVKQKVRYIRDPEDVEYLQDPSKMVRDIQAGTSQGDCDDMSLLVATLLLSIGCQPYFRAVRYESAIGNYNHIYVVLYEKNPFGQEQRVVLDCILKNRKIGSEVNHVNGEEYPV